MMRRLFFLILMVSVFASSEALGQQRALNELTDQDCLGAGSASVLVYDLELNEELYFFDPHRDLPTASIQKMMSSAAALHHKGEDYRFLTQVGFTGEIKDGVLHGDLIVVGSGDPSLGSEYFPDYPSISKMKDRKSTRLNSSHVAISYAVF